MPRKAEGRADRVDRTRPNSAAQLDSERSENTPAQAAPQAPAPVWIPLTAKARLRISRTSRAGGDLVEFRVCTELAGGTNIFAPTKDGFSIPAAALSLLTAALAAAHVEGV